ncbi:MAG: hypothetical protein ACTHJT_15155, partial [Cytophaga sp.]
LLSVSTYALSNKDIVGNWVEHDRKLKFGFDEKDILIKGNQSESDFFIIFGKDSICYEKANLLGDKFVVRKDSIIEFFSPKSDLKSGGYKKYRLVESSQDRLVIEQYYRATGNEIVYQYTMIRYTREIPSPISDFYASIYKPDQILFYASTMPQYPGGEVAKKEFIQKHITHLSASKIIFSVVIDTSGNISKVEYRLGTPFEDAKMITTMLRQMPEWSPGKNNDQLVFVRMSMTIAISKP